MHVVAAQMRADHILGLVGKRRLVGEELTQHERECRALLRPVDRSVEDAKGRWVSGGAGAGVFDVGVDLVRRQKAWV